MSSPPTPIRNSRVVRKQEIPANLVLTWQSSALRAAKPSVRRPKTACERCRTAKVKCHGDGQHECDRCINRRLPCKYDIQPVLSPSSTSSRHRSASGQNTKVAPEKHPGVDAVYDEFGGHDADFQHLLDSATEWSQSNDIRPPVSSDQQQRMYWTTTDPVLDWTPGMSPGPMDLNLPRPLPSTFATTSNTSATDNTTGSTPASEQQPSLSSLGLFPLIDNTTAADLCWQDQLGSESCQCRTGLALLIPDAKAALQQQQLDAVCRVIRDVIKRCQDIVSCKSCGVNCTDLICIMAVFQEADVCFEYIAKGSIDKPISISMGSYEMAVDEQDAKPWRRMLVIQLVRRANELLNSISARGQDMLRKLDPGCRLGRVNIDYLEAVIGNSRDNFQHIMKGFRDEARAVA